MCPGCLVLSPRPWSRWFATSWPVSEFVCMFINSMVWSLLMSSCVYKANTSALLTHWMNSSWPSQGSAAQLVTGDVRFCGRPVTHGGDWENEEEKKTNIKIARIWTEMLRVLGEEFWCQEQPKGQAGTRTQKGVRIRQRPRGKLQWEEWSLQSAPWAFVWRRLTPAKSGRHRCWRLLGISVKGQGLGDTISSWDFFSV